MVQIFTPDDVKHIAKLAQIPISDEHASVLSDEFIKTLSVIENLDSLDVSKVSPIHMTGLSNVFREDVVDEARMFTQEQALANAAKIHDGFFVVGQLIDQGDE